MRSVTVLVVIVSALMSFSVLHVRAANPEGIPASAIGAKVVEHLDGDKIVVYVLGAEREVLMAGIDAPEPGECFFEESASRVAELIPVGAEIYLETSGDDQDGKNRLIRYVWVPREGLKGYLLNTKLAREGYAGFSDDKDSPRYFDNLREGQQDAQDNDRGLWGACQGLHGNPIEVAAEAEGDSVDAGSGSRGGEDRCEFPVIQVVTAIESGLDAGIGLVAARAVKSGDDPDLYFVAAGLTGPGIEPGDAIGVWVVPGISESPTNVYSANAFAEEFGVWPLLTGSLFLALVELKGADGIEEAIECTEDAISYSPHLRLPPPTLPS